MQHVYITEQAKARHTQHHGMQTRTGRHFWSVGWLASSEEIFLHRAVRQGIEEDGGKQQHKFSRIAWQFHGHVTQCWKWGRQRLQHMQSAHTRGYQTLQWNAKKSTIYFEAWSWIWFCFLEVLFVVDFFFWLLLCFLLLLLSNLFYFHYYYFDSMYNKKSNKRTHMFVQNTKQSNF